MKSTLPRKFLLLVFGVSLAACGGNAPAASPTATPAPPAIVTATSTVAPSQAPTSAPTPTSTPTAVPATNTALPPTAVPVTQGPDLGFVPNGQSVWEVPSTPDTMTGTCTGGPLSVPYGRIAITPSGNSLEFRDQGVGTYTFYLAQKNVYTYNGRSNLAAGNLAMTITFNNAQNWTMHAITVLDDDPQCQHNHDYSAVFKWMR